MLRVHMIDYVVATSDITFKKAGPCKFKRPSNKIVMN